MKKVLLLLVSLFLFSPFLLGQSPCATDLIQYWKELADSNHARQHAVHQQKVNRNRTEQILSNEFWNQYHDENDSSEGAALQGLIGGSGPGCRNARYVIPVVIHIVHDPAHSTPGTGSNISDSSSIKPTGGIKRRLCQRERRAWVG